MAVNVPSRLGAAPAPAADARGRRAGDHRRGRGAAARAAVPRADRRRGHAADRAVAAVVLRLLPRPPPPRAARRRAHRRRAVHDGRPLVQGRGRRAGARARGDRGASSPCSPSTGRCCARSPTPRPTIPTSSEAYGQLVHELRRRDRRSTSSTRSPPGGSCRSTRARPRRRSSG